MIRKTALLTGIAGALLFAAPVLAQGATMLQTPEPAPTEAAAAQPQSLTLTPGAVVRSADGAELGKLVGVQNGASGQELTVRGADGAVRPVGLAGIRQDGAEIVVDATLSDFQAAAPISSEAPTEAAPDATPPTLPTEPDSTPTPDEPPAVAAPAA